MSRLLDNALALSLIILAGFLSTSGYFIFWGVKPNLVLSLIIAFIFLRASSFEIAFLVVFAAASLAWTPLLSPSLFILPLLAAAILSARRFFSSSLFSASVISFAATFLWYLASNPHFALNFYTIVVLEGIINSVLSLALILLGRALKVFVDYA